MADLRLISQSDIQTGRGGSSGAEMGNIGVGDGLATAGYGDLMQNVGGKLFQMSDRINRAREATAEIEADRIAAEGYDSLIAELEAIPDETGDDGTRIPKETRWAEVARDRMAEIKEAMVNGEGLSANARRRVEERAEAIGQNQLKRIETLAQARTVERLKAAFVVSADSAFERGDKEEGERILDRMAAEDLEFPEEIDARKLKGRRYADVLEANRDMEADPIGTVDAFADEKSYPDLDANQRLSLRREAEVRMRRLQADNAQELAMKMDQGEPVSEDELRRKVDSKELTATAAKAIRKALGGMKSGAMASTMSEIDRKITAYDPLQDTDTAKYYEVQDLIYALPAERRSELLGRLQDKRDPKSQSNRSAVTDAYKHADWMLDSGMLGPVTREKKSGKIDPSEEAIWKHLRMKDEIDRIVEENPGIDREGLIKLVRKANQPAQEAPAMELAMPESLPGSIPSGLEVIPRSFRTF